MPLRGSAARSRRPDHILTFGVRHDLCLLRYETGDPAGAAEDARQLLADHLRVHGPANPVVHDFRRILGDACGAAGNTAEAIAEFELPVADSTRRAGPDDFGTLSARSRLAHWRGEAGDPRQAVPQFELLVADYVRVAGAEHPDTILARLWLAEWRGRAGDVTGAISDADRLLADATRTLGPDHTLTRSTDDTLEYWSQHPSTAESEPSGTGRSRHDEWQFSDKVRQGSWIRCR